jgi:hypothetical protein
VTSRVAGGADVAGSTHVGFEWRLGQSEPGWGWKFALNWFSADIERTVAGQNVQLGELHVRPVMGGYGYTQIFGKTAVSYNMLGGYAFGKFDGDDGAQALYRSLYGQQSDIKMRAHNTFALKPEISAWRELTEKVGLHAAVAYVIARPVVSIESPAGIDRRTLRADMLQLKIGVVYRVF